MNTAIEKNIWSGLHYWYIFGDEWHSKR